MRMTSTTSNAVTFFVTIALPSSEQRRFAQPAGNGVCDDQEYERYDVHQQPYRRRIAQVVSGRLDTVAVNVGVHHVRGRIGARAVHQQDLLIVVAQNAGDSQDEQNADRGQDAGQRDVPHLLDASGSVQHGGLVHLGIDARDGGQIDDGAVADALPDAGADIQRPECRRHHKEVLPFKPQRGQQLVHRAVAHVEKLLHHADHDDDRQEIRHVGNRLHDPLKPGIAQFVEQQRQQNGRREGKKQAFKTQNKRVADDAPAERVAEKRLKMLQTDPLGMKEAALGRIVLIRDHNAVHGQKLEKKQVDQTGNQHDIQHPVEPHVFPQGHIPAGASLPAQQILRRWHCFLRH